MIFAKVVHASSLQLAHSLGSWLAFALGHFPGHFLEHLSMGFGTSAFGCLLWQCGLGQHRGLGRFQEYCRQYRTSMSKQVSAYNGADIMFTRPSQTDQARRRYPVAMLCTVGRPSNTVPALDPGCAMQTFWVASEEGERPPSNPGSGAFSPEGTKVSGRPGCSTLHAAKGKNHMKWAYGRSRGDTRCMPCR